MLLLAPKQRQRMLKQSEKRRRHAGKEWAIALRSGDFLAVEARLDPNDKFWAAIAINAEGKDSPIVEVVDEARKTIAGTLYTRGDYCLAVQYCKRVVGT